MGFIEPERVCEIVEKRDAAKDTRAFTRIIDVTHEELLIHTHAEGLRFKDAIACGFCRQMRKKKQRPKPHTKAMLSPVMSPVWSLQSNTILAPAT
jgi:hypothetical protein